ncbi:MAG: hypothetical protein IJC81_05685 [Clostridia bacterium]|nr:hypothetical protein [Clostridia bacterium]
MVNLQSASLDRLFEAILNLKTTDDCYKFFEDICTIKELQDMAQRLDVAFLLTEGINYQKISQEVNVSTATISRVSKCLNYGTGGYKAAIEQIKGKQK